MGDTLRQEADRHPLNYRLKTTADERGWGFIDNSNVGERHLGVDGVHLNKSGQSVFAGNLCRHINQHQRQSRQSEHLNQRREDYSTPLHQRHSNQHLNQRRDEWNPPMQQPSQPRSYAETVAGESTTPSTARGVQQDFNMVSYLANRSQVLCYKETVSSKNTIKCGVPQGSVLGPTLFLKKKSTPEFH